LEIVQKRRTKLRTRIKTGNKKAQPKLSFFIF
jgi:hypothetical protein